MLPGQRVCRRGGGVSCGPRPRKRALPPLLPVYVRRRALPLRLRALVVRLRQRVGLEKVGVVGVDVRQLDFDQVPYHVLRRLHAPLQQVLHHRHHLGAHVHEPVELRNVAALEYVEQLVVDLVHALQRGRLQQLDLPLDEVDECDFRHEQRRRGPRRVPDGRAYLDVGEPRQRAEGLERAQVAVFEYVVYPRASEELGGVVPRGRLAVDEVAERLREGREEVQQAPAGRGRLLAGPEAVREQLRLALVQHGQQLVLDVGQYLLDVEREHFVEQRREVPDPALFGYRAVYWVVREERILLGGVVPRVREPAFVLAYNPHVPSPELVDPALQHVHRRHPILDHVALGDDSDCPQPVRVHLSRHLEAVRGRDVRVRRRQRQDDARRLPNVLHDHVAYLLLNVVRLVVDRNLGDARQVYQRQVHHPGGDYFEEYGYRRNIFGVSQQSLRFRSDFRPDFVKVLEYHSSLVCEFSMFDSVSVVAQLHILSTCATLAHLQYQRSLRHDSRALRQKRSSHDRLQHRRLADRLRSDDCHSRQLEAAVAGVGEYAVQLAHQRDKLFHYYPARFQPRFAAFAAGRCGAHAAVSRPKPKLTTLSLAFIQAAFPRVFFSRKILPMCGLLVALLPGVSRRCHRGASAPCE
ncbi:pentatricopeptide repeat-containing At4g19890 isoform X1, putative [Babesia caballi]|uniref:Pentatricopeptide repeat-containing At4g19890 isoform X1, putative n=1 Tax=Babesia caballi TaxID=5871 RepID=A0AAV4LUV5_BABCB|nr:pentatricopeptide repeat-containing At4g19890 isoform X1, putative [Babesia caballi]